MDGHRHCLYVRRPLLLTEQEASGQRIAESSCPVEAPAFARARTVSSLAASVPRRLRTSHAPVTKCLCCHTGTQLGVAQAHGDSVVQLEQGRA